MIHGNIRNMIINLEHSALLIFLLFFLFYDHCRTGCQGNVACYMKEKEKKLGGLEKCAFWFLSFITKRSNQQILVKQISNCNQSLVTSNELDLTLEILIFGLFQNNQRAKILNCFDILFLTFSCLHRSQFLVVKV